MEYKKIKVKKGWLSLIPKLFMFLVYLIGVGLFAIIVVGLWELYLDGLLPLKIEVSAYWSQVIVAYAALFAIAQYAVSYSEASERKTKSVLKLVKFFREDVLEKGDEILKKIKKGELGLPQILLAENTPVYEFTKEEYSRRIRVPQKDSIKLYIQLAKKDFDEEIKIRSCLNAAEEFSIGVINTSSHIHKAVYSIRKPFIQIVEQLAIPLFYYIGITNDGFPYLTELYRCWKKEVGFIPDTQQEMIKQLEEKNKQYNKIIN